MWNSYLHWMPACGAPYRPYALLFKVSPQMSGATAMRVYEHARAHTSQHQVERPLLRKPCNATEQTLK